MSDGQVHVRGMSPMPDQDIQSQPKIFSNTGGEKRKIIGSSTNYIRPLFVACFEKEVCENIAKFKVFRPNKL